MAKHNDPAAPWMDQFFKQWQAWRKHLADNERRGLPNVREGAPPVLDDNDRLVFADWLQDRDDPRHVLVRKHDPGIDVGEHNAPANVYALPHHYYDFRPFTVHPQTTVLAHGRVRKTNVTGNANKVVPVVWRHSGKTSARYSWGRVSWHPAAFAALLNPAEYFAIADARPDKEKRHWVNYATYHGIERPKA